jgi:hypothetical protein
LYDMLSCAEALLKTKIKIQKEFNKKFNKSFVDKVIDYLGKVEFYDDLYLIDNEIHPIRAFNDIITIFSKYNAWTLNLKIPV